MSTPMAISFAAPAFLAALLVIPLGAAALVYARRRRRKYAVRFPALTTLAAVLPRTSGWRRRVPPMLLALAAAALVFALARPQATVAEPVERASVMLVMDTSRSMLADDVDPSRLEAARSAALRFLERVPERLQVGLVAFSTAPHTSIPPTTERDEVRYTLSVMGADGGTATGDAIVSAVHRLQSVRGEDNRRAPSAIVLLSDGKATDGVDPVGAARQAGRLKIPIYTVALGTPSGVVSGGPFRPPISVPPDPKTLREMAAASGGQAFEVEDAAELDRVYERLGSQVGVKRKRREVSSAFAGAGLVLLLLAAATGTRWRGRLP
jgi:Ca-activated chloride channel family protein